MNDKQKRGSLEDIPEALRDIPTSPSPAPQRTKLIMAGVIGFGIIILGIVWVMRLFSAPPESVSSTVTPTPSPSPTPEAIENILGHLPYSEASPEQLKSITNDGGIKLRKKAAESFLKMQRDARANGVILNPISGFRTVAQQEYLFFEIKRQRNQETRKRAEVSAPPNYSEHHTGYAVDIGDGKVPATNLSENFEQTPAFRWLENNAAKYSFELSFPPNNTQGISYEPWHWRYVGDPHSLETFYKARNLLKKSSQEDNNIN
ncbi:MAG: M15 family metallopeptidase [Crocosphaera sp.]